MLISLNLSNPEHVKYGEPWLKHKARLREFWLILEQFLTIGFSFVWRGIFRKKTKKTTEVLLEPLQIKKKLKNSNLLL